MKALSLTAATLLIALSAGASASCPSFLNHSMRQLASTENIQFCEAYEGKALLIVNTASYCGYTSQFEGLEQIHREYEDRGLVVLGFSSDDFFQEDFSTAPRIRFRGTTRTCCWAPCGGSWPA